MILVSVFKILRCIEVNTNRNKLSLCLDQHVCLCLVISDVYLDPLGQFTNWKFLSCT